MAEPQIQKTKKRSGRPMRAITKIGVNNYQIALPAYGLFSSSNVDDLKKMLKDAGYNYYMRESIKD